MCFCQREDNIRKDEGLSDQTIPNELMMNRYGKLGKNSFGLIEAKLFILTKPKGRLIVPLNSEIVLTYSGVILFSLTVSCEGNKRHVEFLTNRKTTSVCKRSS